MCHNLMNHICQFWNDVISEQALTFAPMIPIFGPPFNAFTMGMATLDSIRKSDILKLRIR